jgi:hypothetical protein
MQELLYSYSSANPVPIAATVTKDTNTVPADISFSSDMRQDTVSMV